MEFATKIEITNEIIDICFKDNLFLDELNHLLKKLLIDAFKLSNVSKTQHYKILNLLIYNYFVFGIKDTYVNEIINRIGNKKKTLKAIDDLKNANFITATDRTIKLSHTIINIIFNLIKLKQNFDNEVSNIINNIDTDKIRLSDLKNLARSFLKNKNYLSYFEKSIISLLFDEYVYNANCLKFLFKKVGVDLDDEELETKILVLDYRTRFNSKSILYKQIAKFRDLVKNATKKYQFALFLTLTMDTKNFKSVLDAYKEISKSWKKLRDAIVRRLGYKVEYVAVREFHKNGMPHLHILIFLDGLKDKKGNWVISQKWISRLWEKYGMGKIVYIYALKRQGNTYTWLNTFPKGTKTKSITNYLTKYLVKAFNDILELSLFWISNLRFYTYSRNLKEKQIKKLKVKQWEFLGVVKEDNLKEFIEELKQKLEVKNINNINRYSYDYERWFSTLEGIYKLWVI